MPIETALGYTYTRSGLRSHARTHATRRSPLFSVSPPPLLSSQHNMAHNAPSREITRARSTRALDDLPTQKPCLSSSQQPRRTHMNSHMSCYCCRGAPARLGLRRALFRSPSWAGDSYKYMYPIQFDSGPENAIEFRQHNCHDFSIVSLNVV